MDRDLASFLNWNALQWKAPSFTTARAGSGQERGAEFMQVLTVFCCRNLGCSHRDALSVPVRVALLDYLAHQEEDGAIVITEQRDADLESLCERNHAG